MILIRLLDKILKHLIKVLFRFGKSRFVKIMKILSRFYANKILKQILSSFSSWALEYFLVSGLFRMLLLVFCMTVLFYMKWCSLNSTRPQHSDYLLKYLV